MKGNMSKAFKKTDHNALTHRDGEKQHPISAIDGLTEALNGKVPVERTVNGQTLDEDVEIKEVESANKLKTARTINGVAFDGTSNIKVYSESELPAQNTMLNTEGWYRIAEFSALTMTATIHIARGYTEGIPEVYTIIMDTTHDTCRFTQLSSLMYEPHQYITKIRIIYGISRVKYLEVYYASEIANSVTVKFTNIATAYPELDTYSNVAFEAGSIPEGEHVKEFDLSVTPMKISSLQIGETTLTETQLQALLNLLT